MYPFVVAWCCVFFVNVVTCAVYCFRVRQFYGFVSLFTRSDISSLCLSLYYKALPWSVFFFL